MGIFPIFCNKVNNILSILLQNGKNISDVALKMSLIKQINSAYLFKDWICCTPAGVVVDLLT